jgi:hypothetical protein
MASKQDPRQSSPMGLGGFPKFIIISAVLALPLAIFESVFRLGFLSKFYTLIPDFLEDGFYWFFSSLAQSMAALFGIGGLFAVYFFQELDRSLNDLCREAQIKMCLDPMVLWEVGRLQTELKRIAAQPVHNQASPEAHYREKGETFEKKISAMRDKKKIAIGSLKSISLFVAALIALSILAIPFSRKLAHLVFGVLFAFLLMMLAVLGLIKMVRFIADAVDQRHPSSGDF